MWAHWAHAHISNSWKDLKYVDASDFVPLRGRCAGVTDIDDAWTNASSGLCSSSGAGCLINLLPTTEGDLYGTSLCADYRQTGAPRELQPRKTAFEMYSAIDGMCDGLFLDKHDAVHGRVRTARA